MGLNSESVVPTTSTLTARLRFYWHFGVQARQTLSVVGVEIFDDRMGRGGGY